MGVVVGGWWVGRGYSLPIDETVADHGIHRFPTTTLPVINLDDSETGGTEART